MISNSDIPYCSGFCPDCGSIHSLKQGRAGEYCLELMKILEEKGRIDIHAPEERADPIFSLEYIRGEAGGQMFGVLECIAPGGDAVFLKAFSGQYNGQWIVEGWAPPLFDAEAFDLLVDASDKLIKDLGKKIALLFAGKERDELFRERKGLSRGLMKKIHALYTVRNFRSGVKPLSAFFKSGIPAGAGDCCAPKLLNEAALQGLVPVGIAEIYWGRTNRSGTRKQGEFYGACMEKCQPILGFMLCGLD